MPSKGGRDKRRGLLEWSHECFARAASFLHSPPGHGLLELLAEHGLLERHPAVQPFLPDKRIIRDNAVFNQPSHLVTGGRGYHHVEGDSCRTRPLRDLVVGRLEPIVGRPESQPVVECSQQPAAMRRAVCGCGPQCILSIAIRRFLPGDRRTTTDKRLAALGAVCFGGVHQHTPTLGVRRVRLRVALKKLAHRVNLPVHRRLYERRAATCVTDVDQRAGTHADTSRSNERWVMLVLGVRCLVWSNAHQPSPRYEGEGGGCSGRSDNVVARREHRIEVRDVNPVARLSCTVQRICKVFRYRVFGVVLTVQSDVQCLECVPGNAFG
eukprot:COSAG06_NODE_343_length_17092_cov_17.908021_4_plen_324_part_00